MGVQVERIIESWDYNFEKEGWHVSLLPSLRGLTAAQAAWRPHPERHNIWEIVNHISLWKEYYRSRLAGEPPWPRGWPKVRDWQPVAETGEQAWQETLRRLASVQEALKVEFSKRSDEELDQPLAGAGGPLYAVSGLATHDAYHCGQICYIRALQRIPAKGSWDNA